MAFKVWYLSEILSVCKWSVSFLTVFSATKEITLQFIVFVYFKEPVWIYKTNSLEGTSWKKPVSFALNTEWVIIFAIKGISWGNVIECV